eukprot:gnl/MRDRNA2_/MRDRNA2_95409_c0_seq1.p1 gnl/MRDRNA2_/MRDRNA2_95409_c0~~gnl/MRDRNA2_/MRDRNA2_95409_c0_seq1.p1  ORF type:complete len:222 (+),score=48.30 gnl/MRDRNA2_/MRDRNA2_95409_c0_seq1:149-814(+)
MRGNKPKLYPKSITKTYIDDCGADAEAEAYAMAMASSATAPEAIHPHVYDLCNRYRMEDALARKLHEAMKWRQETFEGDLQRLEEHLRDGRDKKKTLEAKLREMENGTFQTKPWLPDDLDQIAVRWKLDDRARQNLAEGFAGRFTYQACNRESDLMRLDAILASHPCPSAKINSGTLMFNIRNGHELPDPVTEEELRAKAKGKGFGSKGNHRVQGSSFKPY